MSYTVDDPLGLYCEFSSEEQLIASTVRDWVRRRFLPIVGDAWRAGGLPEGMPRELGELGLLGMHLEGYGCAGASATAYGLACLELEAGDSGLRSMVSVQGSLAMFAIHRYGSEEQKQRWLERMAAGEVIGCFGLTRSSTNARTVSRMRRSSSSRRWSKSRKSFARIASRGCCVVTGIPVSRSLHGE